MGSLLDRQPVGVGQLHPAHLDLLVEEGDGRDELAPLVEQAGVEDIDGLRVIRTDLTRMDQRVFEQIHAGEDGRHTGHEGVQPLLVILVQGRTRIDFVRDSLYFKRIPLISVATSDFLTLIYIYN